MIVINDDKVCTKCGAYFDQNNICCNGHYEEVKNGN